MIDSQEVDDDGGRDELPQPTAADACALCGRLPKRGTTKHHLIPRTCHSNKWFKKRYSRKDMSRTVNVCRDCHRAIHHFLDEKQLGREYNTLAKLAEQPSLVRFVHWARRQK